MINNNCARPALFSAPAKGRQIIAGFSYIKRIGKNAATRFWVPEPFLDQTVQWAAVREFELLQESGNLVIEDLEVTDINRSFNSLQKMRGGGYRVTMISLGCYTENSACDDLKILDEKLQEEITRLINFLYLGEQSEAASALLDQALKQETWSCADALPHIAQALGERRLFKPHKQTTEERAFFDILETLPATHIIHDLAVGLALPDATKEKNWVYLAKGEHKIAAFFAAIGTTMGEVIHHHMRSYGQRLTPDAAGFQRRAAVALRG